jgi:hypothetical protein
MATENELIEAMQKDVAYLKRKLASLESKASAIVTINHKEGRFEASAAAMAWQADVARLRADILSAHSKSSIALAKHYGADIIAAGPFR